MTSASILVRQCSLQHARVASTNLPARHERPCASELRSELPIFLRSQLGRQANARDFAIRPRNPQIRQNLRHPARHAESPGWSRAAASSPTVSSEEADTKEASAKPGTKGEDATGVAAAAVAEASAKDGEVEESKPKAQKTTKGALQKSKVKTAAGLAQQGGASPTQAALDWALAKQLQRSGRLWRVKVVGLNKGGALVRFGKTLCAFLPFSQMTTATRDLRNARVAAGTADAGEGKESSSSSSSSSGSGSSSKDSGGSNNGNSGGIEGETSGDVTHPAKTPEPNTGEPLLNRFLMVQVVGVDQAAGTILVSERGAVKQKALYKLKVGDVRDGVIATVADYGAFVDLISPKGERTGLGGLVHVSELSWDPVQNVADVVAVGQRVQVKVISVDREKRRVAFSMKQLQPDPLLDTLDTLLPSSAVAATSRNGAAAAAADSSAGVGSSDSAADIAANLEAAEDEVLGQPLPGLDDVCNELRREQGIEEVVLGRKVLERRVVAQDLELWLSNAAVEPGRFTLVARAGRQVQEVVVKASLNREAMKATLQQVTSRVL